jgi:hypothetical protein
LLNWGLCVYTFSSFTLRELIICYYKEEIEAQLAWKLSRGKVTQMVKPFLLDNKIMTLAFILLAS